MDLTQGEQGNFDSYNSGSFSRELKETHLQPVLRPVTVQESVIPENSEGLVLPLDLSTMDGKTYTMAANSASSVVSADTHANIDNRLDASLPHGTSNLAALIKKWPSTLMRLMNENDDDEWIPVVERIRSHPEEILVKGRNGGQGALHAACVRYPPVHVIQAMIDARPEAALTCNFSQETPLHLASYSASEEVQEILIRAAPKAASMADQYGDVPLHFAARAGATYQLTELLVQAAPECISTLNKRGVSPFWLLPRSYLEADDLQEILEEESEDYGDDWNLMVLFLQYAYFGVDGARNAPQAFTFSENPNFSWLVHAAASTPTCPREVLRFLCRLFPTQALSYNEQGFTPLLLAVQADEVSDPTQWSENEDGFRQPVEAAEGQLQNESDANVPDNFMQLETGDSCFVEHLINGSTSQDCETCESSRSRQESVVDVLLEWSPISATYADKEGRLPLAVALRSGRSWKTIRRLISGCPRALEYRDVPSGFFMYQIAAVHSPDLDTVFSIVRSLPQLLGASHPDPQSRRRPSEDGSSPLQSSTKRARLED